MAMKRLNQRRLNKGSRSMRGGMFRGPRRTMWAPRNTSNLQQQKTSLSPATAEARGNEQQRQNQRQFRREEWESALENQARANRESREASRKAQQRELNVIPTGTV